MKAYSNPTEKISLVIFLGR